MVTEQCVDKLDKLCASSYVGKSSTKKRGTVLFTVHDWLFGAVVAWDCCDY